MKTYTDKPYDEAKRRWKMIAIYAVMFTIGSMAIRYGLPNVHW